MGKRLSLATENTLPLFVPAMLVAAAFGYFQLQGKSSAYVITAIAVAAVACLVLTLLTLLFPVLVGHGRYTVWSCLMLAAMHVSLMVVTVAMVTATRNPLLDLPEQLRAILIWMQPTPIGLALLGEFILLAWAHLRVTRTS